MPHKENLAKVYYIKLKDYYLWYQRKFTRHDQFNNKKKNEFTNHPIWSTTFLRL